MDKSFLCTNGALVVCTATGFFAGSIWSFIDRRYDGIVASDLLRVSGAIIGAGAGVILDYFIAPWC
jgi:hypothetical protein